MLRVASGLLLLFLQAGNNANAIVHCVGEWERAYAALLRIQREWPLRPPEDALVSYVQHQIEKLSVALRVERRQQQPDLAWHVYIVRNREVNAFSIGGGYVVITEGALKSAQNESELAAILAHEMGHQLAGHFCGPQSYDESRTWFDILSSPKVERDEVGVGSMTQVIDPVKEQQADEKAVLILRGAGYDPRAMLDVARRLSERESGHLVDPRRIQALQRLVGDLPRVPPRESANFQRIKRILDRESPLR